jgi:hypothetical protein
MPKRMTATSLTSDIIEQQPYTTHRMALTYQYITVSNRFLLLDSQTGEPRFKRGERALAS